MRWLPLLFVTIGCAVDPCEPFADNTCIAVEVRGNLRLDQLFISASGAFTLANAASPADPLTTPVSPPLAIAVLAGDTSGPFLLQVSARLFGEEIATGPGIGSVQTHQSTSTVVDLIVGNSIPDLAEPPDQARPFDLAGIDLRGVDLRGVQCDLVTQQPCPGGQKCVALNGMQSCQPDGPQAVAQSCVTDPADNCARGTQCLFIGDLTAGRCEQFCGSDGDCKQSAVGVGGTKLANNIPHCLFQLNGSGPIDLCSLACNPVSSQGASGCPSGAVCVYGSNGALPEFTFCDRAGTGTDGQACNAGFRCAAGFNCLGVGGSTLCRAMCRANTNGDCASPLVCKPGAGGAPPMFGYCCPAAGC